MSVTDLLRSHPVVDVGPVEHRTDVDEVDAQGAQSYPILLTRPIPRRRRHISARIPRWAWRVVGPLAVLGLWQLVCSLGVFTEVEVASPLQVFDAARQLWDEGALQSNLLISLQRVAEGLAVGVSLGVVLAVVSGLFRLGEDLLDPVIHMARSVPILGLLPLAIIWFGVGETPKIFLIASGRHSRSTSTRTPGYVASTSSSWRPARRSGSAGGGWCAR